ncbi:peptidoglycan-binding LysM domain-containing protein [Actinidia rufa]|uniref:Peptidoglycan-binding LysM domain-containing protein n=1 Tax=Actinidia rufa TaxID=165716 RepID=A0A7J0GWV9_9ERIC|nr:peptidoglycan-binding LysM domain-containing protein [Actinidia rufa]
MASKKASILAIADAASWYCAIALIALILLSSLKENSRVRGRNQVLDLPCDEIYVVGEGETLHTINDKCDDPYIS